MVPTQLFFAEADNSLSSLKQEFWIYYNLGTKDTQNNADYTATASVNYYNSNPVASQYLACC